MPGAFTAKTESAELPSRPLVDALDLKLQSLRNDLNAAERRVENLEVHIRERIADHNVNSVYDLNARDADVKKLTELRLRQGELQNEIDALVSEARAERAEGNKRELLRLRLLARRLREEQIGDATEIVQTTAKV